MVKDISRRNFTRKLTCSALGFGSLETLRSGIAGAAPKCPPAVALQLYTIRDLTAKDFTGTLQTVAKLGYDGVEFAGYGGLYAKEMRKRLDDLGLRSAGSHEGFDRLKNNLNEVIEYNLAIGNRWLVCPSMPRERRGLGAAGFREFGKELNAIGARAAEQGMQLCYHNHDFEFVKVDERSLIDFLLEASDPELVQAEVDVYWVQYAGSDPAAFIERYSGRCPLIHMKDMADDAERSFAPVGTGVLNMKKIIRAAGKNNAAWYIVEQDASKQPILDSVAASLQNLRELLKG